MPYHRSIVNMLPSWGVILILILCFGTVALISYFTLRRFYPKVLTETLTPAFGVIGTAVAFLLGFTIALLWQNYQNALKLSLDEASNFYLILENIRALSVDNQTKVIAAVQEYFKALNTQEWPALRLGLGTSAAWDAFSNIYDTMRSIVPSATESNSYTTIIKLLDSIAVNRLARLQTVDPLLSIDLLPVIIFGAFFLVFSVAANNPESKGNHAVTMMLICTLLAINIGLAILITYPFSGAYGIQAKALLEGIPQKLSKLERDNNMIVYKKLAETGTPPKATK